MIWDSMSVVIKADTISEAWEKSVIETWNKGIEVPTEYGEKSKELLGLLVFIKKPFDEPRIHRGDVNASIKKALLNYYDEILHGTLDWAAKEGKIHYTYHERLFSYPPNVISQIDFIIKKLQQAYFSRRAQAITWDPEKDMWVDSPPCLQRIWCTIRDNSLVMQTTWRSRDVFRAMHMNILAMTELQKMIANQLNVEIGGYLDFINSAHIYEKSFKQVEDFINVLKKR